MRGQKLALSLPGARAGYLNWDVAEHPERILPRELPPTSLWTFGEIDKYWAWRGFLKGLFESRAYGGVVEIVFDLPAEVPHFVRG